MCVWKLVGGKLEARRGSWKLVGEVGSSWGSWKLVGEVGSS